MVTNWTQTTGLNNYGAKKGKKLITKEGTKEQNATAEGKKTRTQIETILYGSETIVN